MLNRMLNVVQLVRLVIMFPFFFLCRIAILLAIQVHLSLIGGTISGERLNNLNFNKLILNGVKLKKFLF